MAAKTASLSPAQLALLKQRLKARRATGTDRPIERRGQRMAPLSFAQELLWLVDQLAPDKVNYTVPRIMRLKGPVNVPALERALTAIVDRHEVLRTSITVVNGAPVQEVRPLVPVRIGITDLRDEPEASRLPRALSLVGDLIRRPFDLSRDELIRPTLIQLAQDDYVFLLESHHIASDGWSKGVFFQELETLYEAECLGRPEKLPELPIQYSDYALWQREVLSEAVLQKELSYWSAQLDDAPPLLEFPSAKPRPSVQSFAGKGQRFDFPKELLDAAQQFSTRESVTLFMTLLAAFDAFVCRYTGQTDIVVGTPIAGRTRPELENLIGYFTNTLALRTDVGGNPTFRELLRRVRTTALAAYEHQELPFEVLVKELRPDRTLSHSPIFQVMFSVGHAAQPTPRLYQLETTPVFVERGTSRFDLLFGATALPDGLALACEYNTDLFDDETIRQIAGCYRTLLVAALAEPDRHISELPLLSEAEAHTRLVEWNRTASPFPDSCIHNLFEAQVARTPAAIAVEDEYESVTYAELNRRANRIARWLRAHGAELEAPVGICLHRSVRFASTLLGILKSGCACVLLDPALPSGRLQQIAEDAKVFLLLTEQRLKDRFGNSDRVVSLDAEAGAIQMQPAEDPRVAVRPDHAAFIIYTSGSTGVPKGVLLEHRGMVNHHSAVIEEFGLTTSDRVLQFAMLGFDISLEEMLPAWLSGAAVVFRTETISGREFLSWLERRRITVMDVPTAFWHEWVHDLASLKARPPDSLRLLIVGGERASRAVLTLWQQIVDPRVRWINTYGPTEASIIATAYDPSQYEDKPDDRDIPIGRPIANVQIYILDNRMQAVPDGVPGELYIGGVGVARGYVGRPDLTSERFVDNPFGDRNGRLYRTGDLARYRSDGQIEFVGRNDDQLKIRGFRVEPAEVESVVSQQPGVHQAVVVGVPGPQPQLVAYVVPSAGAERNGEALRATLHKRFPTYMVPAAFVFLDELPLTPQGKLDRKRLPSAAVPAAADAPQSTLGVRDPLLHTLKGIWERVLNRRPIDTRDDFFDLGGHSLLAVRLLAEIRQLLGVELPLATLFTSRTIEALADIVAQEERPQRLPTLTPIQPNGSRPPLFCVSRPNVNALGYIFLSRHLGSDQPVYGLQSHLRDASREPYTQTEFETTAAEYIAAMRKVRPEGPYFLIGNCEGAHIAYEMCRQLQAAGDDVGLLAVLDAWPQENTRRFHLFLIHYYLLRFRQFIRSGGGLAFLRRRFSGWARLLINRVGSGFSGPKAPKPADPMLARYWPGSNYNLPTYQGRALLFRVRKQPYWRIKDYKMGWAQRVLGGVDVVNVPGEHTTILREPNVRVVATYLASRIADALAERAHAAGERVLAPASRPVAPSRTLSWRSARRRTADALAGARRVLMMCYLYPPIVTSGTMRSVGFASNLRRFAWEPTVLTVTRSRSGHPTGEPVPDDIDVVRVGEFNLTGVVNFLQGSTNRLFRLFGSELKRNVFRELLCMPDANIGWLSLAAAVRRARRSDAVYVSCSPFSSALTACFVKLICRKPLVVDFRDAWLLNPYSNLGPLQRRFVRHAEPFVLRICDSLILNTRGAAELYRRTYPQWAKKIVYIPNGYDTLNPAPIRRQKSNLFRIMHVGSFYGSRNPTLILQALAEINDPRIQFVHLGAPWPEFREYEGRVNLQVLSTVRHDQALELMKNASLLYLKQGFETAVSDYIAVAAKTYEYLATGLPILADGPESDNVDIVRKYATSSYIVTSGNYADVRAAILKAHEERHVMVPIVSPDFVREFDRVTLTRQLAEVFAAVTGEKIERPELTAAVG